MFSKNNISKNEVCGIGLSGDADYICIKFNTIKNNKFGIYEQISASEGLGLPEYTNVYKNIISKNEYGIFLGLRSKYNRFIQNIISYNQVGIFISSNSNWNKIWKNNFLKNNIDATFDTSYGNIWLRNFWDNRTVNFGPKIIKGSIKNIPWTSFIKWFNIDLFPSKKPYLITI